MGCLRSRITTSAKMATFDQMRAGPRLDALRGPVFTELVVCRHVIALCGMLPDNFRVITHENFRVLKWTRYHDTANENYPG